MPDKIIPLGKANLYRFWGDVESKKADCPVSLRVCRNICFDSIRLDFSIEFRNPDDEYIYGTRNLLEFAAMPDLTDNQDFQNALLLYKTYRNKDIYMGAPIQREALKQALRERLIPIMDINHLETQKRYLESINLLTISYNGQDYTFGHGWCNGPIPESHVIMLNTLEA